MITKICNEMQIYQIYKVRTKTFVWIKLLVTIVYLQLSIVFLSEKLVTKEKLVSETLNCVLGWVMMLPQDISVNWNRTFSRGNCLRSTDLLRVLLTIRIRIPFILSRVPGSLSQDITPSELLTSTRKTDEKTWD